MNQTEIERYAATLSSLESAEGDDREETQLLRSMGEDAKKYLAAMPWCRRIREAISVTASAESWPCSSFESNPCQTPTSGSGW